MDTPAVPLPSDAREVAVLDRLSVIRDQLLLLKLDRSTYIRSQDVIPLYDETIEQVKDLNAIRAQNGSKEENRGMSRLMLLGAAMWLMNLNQWTRSWRAAFSFCLSSI
jgi:hypothetical protein